MKVGEIFVFSRVSKLMEIPTRAQDVALFFDGCQNRLDLDQVNDVINVLEKEHEKIITYLNKCKETKEQELIQIDKNDI